MRSALVLFVVALAAQPALGTMTQNALDQRISLDLRDAKLGIALGSFSYVLKPAKVQVDRSIQGTLSIRLDNVRIRTALDAICDSLGCTWTLEDDVLEFVATVPPPPITNAEPSPEPVSLSLLKASPADAFRGLASFLGADLDLDPAVQGTLTVELEDAPAREVMKVFCEQLNCTTGLVIDEEGGTRTLIVRPRETP